MNRSVIHSEDYRKKRDALTNYDKLNITECKRIFVKSLDNMLANNFQIESLLVNVKVSYTTIYLDIYYEEKRNIIVMLDIKN